MSEVVDLLKQVLVRLDGIEKDVSDMKNDLSGVKDDFVGVKKDLSDVKRTVNTTQRHVARFDERLTQVEKVPKLFKEDALDMVAEKLAK